MYSQTFASQLVILLALFLPKLGITLGDSDTTALAQGILIFGGILWTLVRRYRIGDVNIIGVKK